MTSVKEHYSISEKDYPSQLNSLEHSAPENIYVRGNHNLLRELDDNRKGIAVIGSRDVSENSYHLTEKFFQDYLIGENWIVISGLARGSDTIGHKCALKYGLKTVAILGPGVNRIYPKENEYLAKEILENEGALISENPPDFYPQQKFEFAKCLVDRDRLQAALSSGIFIVEAGDISGTWYAVSWALRLNKPIFTYSTTNAHQVLSRYINRQISEEWLSKYKIKPFDGQRTRIYFLDEEFHKNNFIKIMGNPILKKHNKQVSLDAYQ
ncbi:MAG: DNA-protecting protein DprA [Candidatus Methanofastidiosum sp.]|nr:DNA-protecting protein DprA [Methanofastidiosum sp.]